MPLKLFNSLMLQVREIIDCEFGILDETGHIFVCSDDKKIGTVDEHIEEVLKEKDTVVELKDKIYQKIQIKNKLEYLAYMDGTGKENRKLLSLFAINVANEKNFYDEKYDKSSFIKNVIMDNILPGDIPLRSKELHMVYNTFRVVFLIRTEKMKDMDAHEVIENLFPNKNKDMIIFLDDQNIVLIRELKSQEDPKEIEKTAKSVVDTLSAELMIQAHVGMGTVAENIRDIARSFKEAQLALLVGRIFDHEKKVINYNNLGIGRLIYQIPTNLCELFLKEVVREGSFRVLDTETMLTIQKFFENNLNVSETSRQLYVHRNTLVYRLDKILRITGLDLRNFDDAIIFKVALLVKRYLDKGNELM